MSPRSISHGAPCSIDFRTDFAYQNIRTIIFLVVGNVDSLTHFEAFDGNRIDHSESFGSSGKCNLGKQKILSGTAALFIEFVRVPHSNTGYLAKRLLPLTPTDASTRPRIEACSLPGMPAWTPVRRRGSNPTYEWNGRQRYRGLRSISQRYLYLCPVRRSRSEQTQRPGVCVDFIHRTPPAARDRRHPRCRPRVHDGYTALECRGAAARCRFQIPY